MERAVVSGRELMARPARLVNPATVGGAVAVAVGLVLVLVPALSVDLIEAVLGLGLLAAGGNDLLTAFRGRARPAARAAALLRGLASLTLAVVFLASDREALAATVLLAAGYLLVRSAIGILLGIVGKDRARRAPRLAAGGVGAAFSLVVLLSPGLYVGWVAVGTGLVLLFGGAVTTVYGYRVASGATPAPEGMYPSLTEILWSWVEHVDIGTRDRTLLAEQLYLERPEIGAKQVAWWTMLVLSVCIATFAVLQDSTAVVIGAMLVAPLMTPILGLAAALISGWAFRAIRSLALIVAGTAAAVLLAYVIASWVPAVVPLATNSQVVSRVDPTLLDMLVAVAAGAAGAFATVDRRVAASLGGVAIAVALVPPLSVVGVSLAAGDVEDAAGAFLLFATNFVSIVLAAAVVFVLAGVADPTRLRRGSRRVLVTLAPFVTAALLILIPLLLTTDGLLESSATQRHAEDVVDDWLDDDARLQLTDVTIMGDEVMVALAGSSDDLPPLDELQSALDAELDGSYRVQVTVSPVEIYELPAS